MKIIELKDLVEGDVHATIKVNANNDRFNEQGLVHTIADLISAHNSTDGIAANIVEGGSDYVTYSEMQEHQACAETRMSALKEELFNELKSRADKFATKKQLTGIRDGVYRMRKDLTDVTDRVAKMDNLGAPIEPEDPPTPYVLKWDLEPKALERFQHRMSPHGRICIILATYDNDKLGYILQEPGGEPYVETEEIGTFINEFPHIIDYLPDPDGDHLFHDRFPPAKKVMKPGHKFIGKTNPQCEVIIRKVLKRDGETKARVIFSYLRPGLLTDLVIDRKEFSKEFRHLHSEYESDDWGGHREWLC